MTDKSRKKIIKEKIKYLETGCGDEFTENEFEEMCGKKDLFGEIKLCNQCQDKIKILKEQIK